LRPAKKSWCDFTEIANALDSPLLARLACAVEMKMRMRLGANGLVWPFFATTYCDRQQQRDGEHLERAKPDVHRGRAIEQSTGTENKAQTLASYPGQEAEL
jgi:hypothetical protein